MRRYQLIPSHAVQTLLITSVSPLPSGEIGAPYSFTFNAIGGVAPYSWSEVGAIPSGLTFSGGTLSGTPTGTFSSSFNVTVMDSIGSQFTKSFSVTIITAVQITTSSPLPNATVGAAYSDTIAATGGSTPYVWSILSQTGANTWNLNSSNGVLSGTPGVAELDSILIQVVDALGIPTSKNFNLTVSSSSGASFDFYVSPTGNDANVGSVAAPWAITSLVTSSPHFAGTAGKRIGFLPGTYNVSTMMDTSSGGYKGAFQINGGTSAASTYYGSSDASGNYSVGTATITALTGGGVAGGGLNYPANGAMLMGCGNDNVPVIPNRVGWLIIDGLRFTGYSFKGVRIGAVSSGDGSPITGDVIIKNCEFFGQSFTGVTGNDNEASLWIDGTATVAAGGSGNYQVTNNYFHDNRGQGGGGSSFDQHLCSVFIFNCANVSITQNTCINAGTFAWGKDAKNQGTTCAYNYIDNTATFTGGAANGVYGFSDFTGDFNSTTGLTLTSNFHHNVVLTNGWGIMLAGAQNYETWQTPVNIYNNTIVETAGGSIYPGMWAVSRNASQVSMYNNIITGAADSSGYKHLVAGKASVLLIDYNGEPATTMSWATAPEGQAGGTPTATYTTAAAFSSAVNGGGGPVCETHTVANNTPGFTGVNTGYLSTTYQLTGGSPFKTTGSTTGTTGGSACEMGAWGGASIPTQIGCTFAP